MAEEQVFELGNDKRVTVREFKGRTLVDIRTFYEKDGNKLPGSKGVSLTEPQWEELVEQMADIEEAISAIKDEKDGVKEKAKQEKKEKRENDKKAAADKKAAEEKTADKKRKAEEEATKEQPKPKTRGKKVLSEEFVKEEDDL